jgi:1-acyl-sn-glycerol-3-phosphate acyltransferase
MGRARWQHDAIARPGHASPFAVRLLGGVLHPLVRLVHGASLEGTAHLPATGAYLLVSNHPPALGAAEFAALAALWAKRFGGARPLAGFAHAASFGWWPLSPIFAQVGAIPSTYAAAEAALAVDVPIVLFPGGDHEGFRPFWRADRVDFNGRLGFLRIARKAWVPVVPMAIAGISTPLLHGSKLLASLFVWPRLVGVKRYGLSVLAVLGAAAIVAWVPLAWPWRALLAWAWAASPLAMLSWFPARVRVRIGPPLAPEALFGERGAHDDDDARLVEALRRVEAAVQAQLDAR